MGRGCEEGGGEGGGKGAGEGTGAKWGGIAAQTHTRLNALQRALLLAHPRQLVHQPSVLLVNVANLVQVHVHVGNASALVLLSPPKRHLPRRTDGKG